MINLYFQCKFCSRELPQGVSAEEYQSISVGLTPDSEHVQIWCERHDCAVVTIELTEEQKQKFNPQLCEVCGCLHPPNHI